MRLRLLAPSLFLLLHCAPPIACSQTISCLPPATRLRIADSLRVLPLVREEAMAWRGAASLYRTAADRYRAADSLHVSALDHSQRAGQGQALLLVSAQVEAATWKQRARRRGLANVVLMAVLVVATYVFITH